MGDLLGSLPLVNTLAAPFTGAISQVYNAQEQRRANERNEQNSWEMFRQQKDLANEAHQRESADLLKAGLNPILGLKGSGSQGAVGQVPTAQPATMDIMAGFNSVMPNLKMLAEINKINAEADILSPKATLHKTANSGLQQSLGGISDAAKMLGEWYGDFIFNLKNKDSNGNYKWNSKPKMHGEDYSRDYFRQTPIYNHNWDKTGE